MPDLVFLFLLRLMGRTLYGAWLLCDLMLRYGDVLFLKAGCFAILNVRADQKMKGICLAIRMQIQVVHILPEQRALDR